jgi:hypothetical protein
VDALAGWVETLSGVLWLLRHDGHSRQHAMGMMMVVAAMVQTNAH